MPDQEAQMLDAESVEFIQNFINRKVDEDNLRKSFPNPLLREDVLSLLERYCTGFFFPLDEEKNNGFHIKVPDRHDEERHFVYINTAQTIEKQAFTAARELGHIWKVDQLVAKKCGLPLDEECGKQIINRFAAELLIPAELFRPAYARECSKRQTADHRITVRDMLRVIVVLMDQFFAPAKSIIYRGWELHYYDRRTRDLLLGETRLLPKSIINAAIQETVRDCGYVQFETPTRKKSIDGLAELLNRAEAQKCVSVDKIRHLRDLFGLKPPVSDGQMDELLN